MDAIAAFTLPLIHGSPQVIIPAGTFDAPNGSLKGKGPWVLNDDDGAALVNKANSGVDIVIDYEHQTILSSQNGKPAPAAGWLLASGIEWQPGVGVVATSIRWTTEAAAMINAGEYRYLSPVFSYNSDGVPVVLLSVAITNTPALTELMELAIAATNRGTVMSQVTEQKSEQAPATTAVLTQPPVAVVTPVVSSPQAAPVAQPLLANSVDGMATMVALLTSQLVTAREEAAAAKVKLAEFEKQVTDSTRQALISAALSDGRLIPAMETWASGLSVRDLQEYITNAKPIAALTGTQTKGVSPATKQESKHNLNADERAVCKALNISPERFIAQRGRFEENE